MIVLALALAMQDVPVYPQVPIELDPLAPLPEVLPVPDLSGEAPVLSAGEPVDPADMDEPVETLAPPAAPAAPARRAVICAHPSFELAMVLQAPDGRTKDTKVTLCAENDEPASFATMLRSARDKLLFDEHFTLASRSAMVDAIDAELARRGLLRPLVESPLPAGR